MVPKSATSCANLLRMMGTLVCGHSKAWAPQKPAVQQRADLSLATPRSEAEEPPARFRVPSDVSLVSFETTVQHVLEAVAQTAVADAAASEMRRGTTQWPRLRARRIRRTLSAGALGIKQQCLGVLRGFNCLRPRSQIRLAAVAEECALSPLEVQVRMACGQDTKVKCERPWLLGTERDVGASMKASKTDTALQLQAEDTDGEAVGTSVNADDDGGVWVHDEPKASFFERAEAMAPLQHRGREALTCLLENVDLEQVRRSLDVEGPEGLLRKYVCEALHGCEISSTAWRDCDQVPGSRVRQLRFRMPLPTDAPEAMKRLSSIPNDTATTVMARIHGDESRLVLNFETQTHDAPFGNNFWVADQFCFEARLGGVQLTKFSGLRWTQALPWYAGFIAPIADSKAHEAAPQTGEVFARIAQG